MRMLPTEFRGCFWDDGWEFDGPAVIYSPWRYRRAGYGGNSFSLDSLVESICYDISTQARFTDGDLARECGWRGWSPRGFRHRKRAWHVVFLVRWVEEADGTFWAEFVKRNETWGPPT